MVVRQRKHSTVAYSNPSPEAYLMPVLTDGRPFDDLLVDSPTIEARWVVTPISIGDCHLLHEPVSIVERMLKADLLEFVEDLAVIEKDGLDNLYTLGGDGDGHDYVIGIKSGDYYVLWHDPTEFEVIASTHDDFIQWIIRERSDHLEGCPWELFVENAEAVRPSSLVGWHPKKQSIDPIYQYAKNGFSWTHDYASSDGFELFDQEHGFGVRFKIEDRGRNTPFRLLADSRTPALEAFENTWTWLRKQGFESYDR